MNLEDSRKLALVQIGNQEKVVPLAEGCNSQVAA